MAPLTGERVALLGRASPAPPMPCRSAVRAAASLAGAMAAAVACAFAASSAAERRRHAPTSPEFVASTEFAEACRDTPGWTDKWAHCAYEPDGTDNGFCRPEPGSFWPATEGWTCQAYKRKGWCKDGRPTADVQEHRNHPEQNCCACGGGVLSAPVAGPPTCSRDTGGTCGFFFMCAASRGSTSCEGGRCMCEEGLCTNNAGACERPQPPTTTAMASQDVQAALGLEQEGDGELCQSTPGWTDGWLHCAYEDGGKSAGLCAPTVGAAWPSTSGWTCRAYAEKGWCRDGKPSGGDMGLLKHFPEQNCCECGGGRKVASPESMAAPQAATSQCERDTGGTCAVASCAGYRGAVTCVSGKCLCEDGFCADSAGTCHARPTAPSLPADAAVRHAFGLHVMTDGRVCQDSVGWTDGATLCAYDEGGRQAELCHPTPGAFWPSTQGWTCRAYSERGWCEGGAAGPEHSGSTKFFPEQHCCACGGGQVIAQGGSRAVAPAVAPQDASTTCYANTGGTCHLTSVCSDFRGPSQCVSGHCVCPAEYCADATGVCRRDVGEVVAQVAAVSRQHPTFPGRHTGVRTALCISGGGSRSMSAALGQFRALQSLGLLDRVDLLSSVSGGTWASSLLMFADMPPEQLLGVAAPPNELTLAKLDEPPAPLGEAATQPINGVMLRLMTAGVPSQMLWVSTIAEVVLKPFGLDSLDAYMAASEDDVERIRRRNPQLRDYKFLVPKRSRPQVFVMSGTVEAPDGYKASANNVVPLQMSPDFSGTPFYPDDKTVSYEATSGTHRPPLRDVLVGGGLVETFAFGGQEPAEGQIGGPSVHLRAPLTPLSLATAVGVSSAAFAALASRLTVVGMPAGARLDPQANIWPITQGRFPGPHQAITYQLGDGSNLDNDGLIAALQRGASKIAVMINTDIPFNARGIDYCAVSAATALPDPSGHVARELVTKFGFDGDEGTFGFYEHNQVFEQADLPPLLCDFSKLQRAGKPLVSKRSLTVRQNLWWGLEGGARVDVVFVYLSGSAAFEAALPSETRDELRKGSVGELGGFPNFKTVLQNADLTALTRRQANLVAAFAEYSVRENAAVFQGVFG